MLEIYDERFKTILEEMDNLCNFEYPEISSETVVDLIISPLQESKRLSSWTWDNGVSKFVLLFSDLDYVIKIPFTHNSDDAYSHYTHNEDGETICDRISGELCGSRSDDMPWNYCESEVIVYKDAVTSGCEDFFAETFMIGKVQGYPIYAQPKAVMFESYQSSYPTKHNDTEIDSMHTYCDDNDFECFNSYWLIDFEEFFGHDALEQLLRFIQDDDVSDLHDGNIGYVNGVPVLVDYAGYDG